MRVHTHCHCQLLYTHCHCHCCICRVLLDVMCLLCVVCIVVNPDTDDQRLAVVREIQRSEDIYLSNVQLLLENYYEPLR